MMRYIDLRSDTVTQPTEEMRQAMLEAPVGDDVYMDDPTVNRLEEEGARILGKEAALYLSSGTQSNQVAVMTWCKRGDEIIVSDGCHIYEHEVGAVAVLAGANMRTLHFEGGIPDASMIEKAIRGVDIHFPETTLICMENALSNGRVVPLSVMKEVYQAAQRHHIPVHLDGARVFNAAASLGVDVKEITQYADSVSCCLSKGLCAPIGTLLAGSREFIQRARKNRKMLGGGMRQAGVIAAPALIALTKMPARLKEDHENARYMAQKLSAMEGICCDPQSVEINMVFFTIDRPQSLRDNLPQAMLQKGVKICPEDQGHFRFVTNNDISREDIDQALAALQECLN